MYASITNTTIIKHDLKKCIPYYPIVSSPLRKYTQLCSELTIIIDILSINKLKQQKSTGKSLSLKPFQVEDIQDQAPVFLNAPYSTTVTEGTEQVNLSDT